ncbi:hypothetical protein SDC9_106698 [bioreactor metagenome]|uniref:Uncharacterized protein n=1 Tax=bioreactor metagenome TaxID=1076179 RepID=A0A645B321_9ZZZZ
MVAAAPIACTTLAIINTPKEFVIPHSKEPIVNKIIPNLKTVVFPLISPSLPNIKIVEEITIK